MSGAEADAHGAEGILRSCRRATAEPAQTVVKGESDGRPQIAFGQRSAFFQDPEPRSLLVKHGCYYRYCYTD